MIVMTSCSPKYYSPNTHNVPLISEKGELNVSTAITGADVTGVTGFELQGALGLTDNICTQLNIGTLSSNYENDSGSASHLELGAGYYRNLSKHFIFETYGLLGFAKMDIAMIPNNEGHTSIYNKNRGSLTSTILKKGAQANIGYRSKYFDLVASTKLSHVSHHSISGNLTYEGEHQGDYLRDNAQNIMLEPALTLRLGYKGVKFQIQTSRSTNLTNPDFRQVRSMTSLGASINISGDRMKKLF